MRALSLYRLLGKSARIFSIEVVGVLLATSTLWAHLTLHPTIPRPLPVARLDYYIDAVFLFAGAIHGDCGVGGGGGGGGAGLAGRIGGSMVR